VFIESNCCTSTPCLWQTWGLEAAWCTAGGAVVSCRCTLQGCLSPKNVLNRMGLVTSCIKGSPLAWFLPPLLMVFSSSILLITRSRKPPLNSVVSFSFPSSSSGNRLTVDGLILDHAIFLRCNVMECEALPRRHSTLCTRWTIA